MNKQINWRKILKYTSLSILAVAVIFIVSQLLKQPATSGDWQTQLAIPSTAEFNGDSVTVKNVRNFRYGPAESDMHPGYYDKTYNLSQLKQVWYVTEPFNGQEYAAHTFLSFEFNNGDFLAITIEARKTKDQVYSPLKGFMRTYPLMYIAADERDVLLLRANLRKDNVYVYPVKLSKPENARLLLVDMLERMNKIIDEPVWYNTLFANCTSSIAYHVNRLSPDRVSVFSKSLWLTGTADELALNKGLLDTDLSIDQARQKYLVTPRSIEIGDMPDYSKRIRNFDDSR